MNKPSGCVGCPLEKVGSGFVLGAGDLSSARLQLLLESPSRADAAQTVDEGECQRRECTYPQIDRGIVRRGMPGCGEAIIPLDHWVLKNVGLSRPQVFVDSTLRCCPPGDKYPTGAVRKKAEAWCRQYDRFDESLAMVTLAPVSLSSDPAPLPLVVRSFAKALDFSAQGERVLLLCGGKTADVWLGYASNASRWMHHYEFSAGQAKERRVQRWEEGKRMTT